MVSRPPSESYAESRSFLMDRGLDVSAYKSGIIIRSGAGGLDIDLREALALCVVLKEMAAQLARDKSGAVT